MAIPLTKHYPDGCRYFRPPTVEATIDERLGQELTTACRRAAITDRRSAEYVPSEALVHLIRDARRRNDEATMDILLPILLRR
jgi:hypothetical protein